MLSHHVQLKAVPTMSGTLGSLVHDLSLAVAEREPTARDRIQEGS